MAKPNVAEKTVNTVLELTGKFTLGFIKAVTGKGSATKEKNLSFGGKAKVKKDGKDTASKIKPLKQGNELLDMLMKIYNFMNKNFEEDKLHREKLDNFKEEAKIEADKRHKALLAQIALLMKEQKGGESAEKLESETGLGLGGIIGSILDALGGARVAMTALSMLGGFVASPLGVALIAALAAGTVGAWMIKQIAGDPQAALEGKGGIGMAVAGLGSEGQLPSYDEEQANKDLTKKAEAVDKKGLKQATLPELEAKLQQQMEFGNAKSPAVAELKKEIELRKSEQSSEAPATPSASPATAAATSAPASSQVSTASSLSPGETAMPAAAAPASAKLNAVQSENNTAKVNALTEPSSSTINNVSSSTALQKPAPQQRVKIPPVRNLEESFQKMITYSTRVV
jgi:hypothetical protein